ncbi:hypothetical protein D8B26_007612 [Coccidioides posadasii str. Silveira]|uniref:Uncharacterized protein n=1 Tax=Coccidioides posadasii (strain RMSCC 757 / Silveira) TaxID=443226 RepID=E9D2G3_COCPS|nr:conserved hypothetical protein [Coccidioides posadasii str. Silveira]QVM12995.1 hypothetical protein D8B26_007612 [Coccidioides posadasii str. Silveira]
MSCSTIKQNQSLSLNHSPSLLSRKPNPQLDTMVKFTSIALAVVGAMASLVAADNCQTGLQYCGYVLLRKGKLRGLAHVLPYYSWISVLTSALGNYYAQIVQALHQAKLPTDPRHVQNTLFQCIGGPNGEIKVIKFCGAACHDGGNNHSDTC